MYMDKNSMFRCSVFVIQFLMEWFVMCTHPYWKVVIKGFVPSKYTTPIIHGIK